MNGNKSVTAYFVPVQYTLSIGVSGQGNTNPAAGSRSCNQGSQVAITAIASSGWKFDHWACDASGTNPSTTILMNGNKSVTACFSQTTVVANYITTIKYQGKTYYVQVIPSGNQAQVWFRLDPNACNSGDFELIVTMQGYLNQTATQVKKLVCSGYNLYDSGKTWLDCGSVLLSVATCSGTVTGVADVVSVGTIADACVVSTNYVITKGAKDCIEGVTGIIAKYLGQSNAFSAYQITTATTKTDLIEATLGAWCEN
jgi:hypothetical protein